MLSCRARPSPDSFVLPVDWPLVEFAVKRAVDDHCREVFWRRALRAPLFDWLYYSLRRCFETDDALSISLFHEPTELRRRRVALSSLDTRLLVQRMRSLSRPTDMLVGRFVSRKHSRSPIWLVSVLSTPTLTSFGRCCMRAYRSADSSGWRAVRA